MTERTINDAQLRGDFATGAWSIRARALSQNAQLPSEGPTAVITVLCLQEATPDLVRRVRQWCDQTDDSGCTGTIAAVERVPNVAAAKEVFLRTTLGVLIAPGTQAQEVLRAFGGRGTASCEIIFCPPLPNSLHARTPSASLLAASSVSTTADPIAALRKAIIRLRTQAYASLRLLASANEFRAYFQLRYRVWRALGYIPDEKLSAKTEYEFDYTDRTAIAIGAFLDNGAIIGCVRIVLPLGQETHNLGVIRSIGDETDDPTLQKNLEYPRFLVHPFDLLESFPKFQDYYHDLVVQRISKAEVSRVIVDSPYQRNGLGEAIVDSAVSIAQRHGIRRLFLACRDNHQHFYERCGFRVLPGMSCEHFVNVRVPAIAMERDLSTEQGV
jgi:GNAT superfamily N-acetyltransferase